MEPNVTPPVPEPKNVVGDGITYVSLLGRKIPVRFLFLAVTLLEFFELELFAVGKLHHLLDAVVFILYGLLMRVMGYSWRTLIVYSGITAIAWGFDLATLNIRYVDIESISWLLSHVILAVFLSSTLKHRAPVTEADIAGAVAFYLMVGIVFANVYNLILGYYPDAIFSSVSKKFSYGGIVYFSFMTQMTVGYGDMVPRLPLVRVVCVLQAIFGIMYISILISWLVSAYIASHPRD